jgi:hypothetical protein
MRVPGTGGSDQGDDLAWSDAQIDAADDCVVAAARMQITTLEHGAGARSAHFTPRPQVSAEPT